MIDDKVQSVENQIELPVSTQVPTNIPLEKQIIVVEQEAICGFMKEASYGLIGSKTFDRTQDVILKHRNRDAGDLGCKIPGLFLIVCAF